LVAKQQLRSMRVLRTLAAFSLLGRFAGGENCGEEGEDWCALENAQDPEELSILQKKSKKEWQVLHLERFEGREVAAETCELQKSKCKLRSLESTTLIQPGGKTTCMHPQEGAYEFVVRKGDPEKLVFFLQGGGACWDPISYERRVCTMDISYSKKVSGLLHNRGIFNSDDSQNPFRTWTMVEVLYCSGDLHVGDVVGAVPQRGYQNTQAALDWVASNVGSLHSLLIMGSSAGALGAQFWSQRILEALPHHHAMVLADSYAGYFPEKTEGPILQGWQSCTVPVFTPKIQDACVLGSITVPMVVTSTMAANTKVIYGQIESKEDKEQRKFFDLVAITFQKAIPPLDGDTFYAATNLIFEEYNKYPNYISFLVDGEHHTFGSSWSTAGTNGPREGSPEGVPSLQEWVTEPWTKSKKKKDDCVSSQCKGTEVDLVTLATQCGEKLLKEIC
ncbi:Pectin acetylesterase 11, partial [Durusdinium trenchii]